MCSRHLSTNVRTAGNIRLIVTPTAEHVFGRLQALTVLLRERVETSEDWLGMARRADRETAAQVEYLLTLMADMCWQQFGKLGQGKYNAVRGGCA